MNRTLEKPFYKPTEVAAMLAVTRTTIYAMFKDGRLPVHKIEGSRRVSRADLDEYLSSVRQVGQRQVA